MNQLKGVVSRIIFTSENNYTVLVIKVLENDIDDSYNGKFITATGYFYDIEVDTNLLLIGTLASHTKYGEQFNTSSYQIQFPLEKNAIITFLSSDLFKGIGEGKALRIYDKLGDDALNLIKNDQTILDEVSGLTKKDREVIVNKLQELDKSSEILLQITELGFSVLDATLIYKKYKEETLSIINQDIYQIILDIPKITFSKVDAIARKNKIKKDDIRRVRAGILHTMQVLAVERGDTYSSTEEISNTLKIIINYDVGDLFYICLNDLLLENKIIEITEDSYQLLSYYEAENNIVKRLTYLHNKEDLRYKKDLLDKKLNEFQNDNNIYYDEIQKEAIKNSFLKNFQIITGGPGTGKTTIIKSIVSLYQDIFRVDYDEACEDIVLLAPTGRASKRIMEATLFKASTIHRFLKWNKDTNKFQVNEHNKSHAKLVIIDEFSMVDTILFHHLLNGLRYDTRIILVGDSNQLPSVSAGNLLKDLIEVNLFPVINLKCLYRQDDDGNIIRLAYDINQGDINYQLFNQNDDLYFYKSSSNELKEHLKSIMSSYKDFDYRTFQIMAPIYKTINGITNLNIFMQELFNPQSKNKNEIKIQDTVYRVGDKVLQLTNMPDDNIYNGDIGIIIEIDNYLKEITIDFGDNLVTFNKSNFQNFTLGYVISIHKSQGSEFDVVIIPILKEYGRMLY